MNWKSLTNLMLFWQPLNYDSLYNLKNDHNSALPEAFLTFLMFKPMFLGVEIWIRPFSAMSEHYFRKKKFVLRKTIRFFSNNNIKKLKNLQMITVKDFIFAFKMTFGPFQITIWSWDMSQIFFLILILLARRALAMHPYLFMHAIF